MNTNKQSILDKITRKMPTCFGDQDKIFAGRPFDEERAKELRKLAAANGISFKEVEDIARNFLIMEGCIFDHVQEQMTDVRKFFAKKYIRHSQTHYPV